MEVTVRGRFALNNLGLMRLLAERGMGIAVLSHALARDAVNAGRLVQVLPVNFAIFCCWLTDTMPEC